MNRVEIIRKDIKDARRLVKDVFYETQRKDLFTWTDERGLVDEVFIAINELASAMDGEFEFDDVQTTSDESLPRLKALVGKRYHINIKRTSWKALIASIPLALNIFRATVDPTAYIAAGASLLGTIEMFRDNLQRLKPEQIVIYLAVKALNKTSKSAPDAAAVADYINSQVNPEDMWPPQRVEELLKEMVLKKILKEHGQGYRIVV
jgi:hypothetical protein